MSIQRLEAIVIMASTLKSWSNHPQEARLVNRSDGCSQNWKDRPRCMRNIMAKDVENSKQCPQHLSRHECLENTISDSKNGRDLVIASISSKKTKMLGENVICLANLASHIHHDFIRKGRIYLGEGNWQRYCNLKVGQQSHSVRVKTLSPK